MKELLKGEDKESLQKAMDDLNKARMKLGEAMYKDQAAAGAAPGGATATDARAAGGPDAAAGAAGGQTKGPDDVIDAEYEVK